MTPDTSGSIPLYAQIEASLAAAIASGHLPPDSQLPTEDGLIDRFGVSRITVRKAIQNLAARGLVEIRRGKGTFVAQPRITQELTELTGFVEDMQALDRQATARVLGHQVIAADATVARQLQLPLGTAVVRIHRVRLADGVPISFDETYLPRAIGEKVVTHDLEVEPIFTLLEERYHIPLLEADYQLEATVAGPKVASALEITAGSPIFLIERTSFGPGQVPVDYEQLYYRGDLIRFVTRLRRRPGPQTERE
jgi:GntR family transcriptional regulator